MNASPILTLIAVTVVTMGTGCTTYSDIHVRDDEVFVAGSTGFLIFHTPFIYVCEQDGDRLRCTEQAVRVGDAQLTTTASPPGRRGDNRADTRDYRARHTSYSNSADHQAACNSGDGSACVTWGQGLLQQEQPDVGGACWVFDRACQLGETEGCVLRGQNCVPR